MRIGLRAPSDASQRVLDKSEASCSIPSNSEKRQSLNGSLKKSIYVSQPDSLFISKVRKKGCVVFANAFAASRTGVSPAMIVAGEIVSTHLATVSVSTKSAK